MEEDTVYAKIFSSLWRGSLRGQADPQHVFIYLLAHADEQGVVEAMPEAIADETGLDLEAVKTAIAHLESPDPQSRTPTNEGRRIDRLDEHRSWCWLITNYEHYRSMSDREKVREQVRERVRRFRARGVTQGNAPVTQVTRGNPKQRQIQKVDTEAEAEERQTTLSALTSGTRRGLKRKALKNVDPLPDGEITADQAFEEIFYPEYPRKKDHEDALKAWQSLKLKDDDDETIRKIMAALRRDVREEWRDRPMDKIPYPAKWLRKKGWLD